MDRIKGFDPLDLSSNLSSPSGGDTMISIHIPDGAQAPDMKQEMSSARNIKDRRTRNATVTGLNKIVQYL